jgi:hypothetical protein
LRASALPVQVSLGALRQVLQTNCARLQVEAGKNRLM